MKQLMIFIFCLISIEGLSQGFPGYTYQSSPNYRHEFKGALQATKGIINGVFTDTSAANSDYIDFYNGAQIYTRSDRNFWLRDSVLNMWIRMAKYTDAAYTANLPIRITTNIISADTSVANEPSLTTNARLKKVTDSLTATIGSGTGAAYSVDGRAANTSGARADIVASNNEDVLFRNADVLQFAKPNLMKRRGNTIGTVFEKADFSDTTGITTYSSLGETTYTIVNGDELRIYTASAPSGTNYLEVDSFTNLDVATIYASYYVDVIGGQTYVLLTGVSGNPYISGNFHCEGGLWTASGGNLGKVLIQTYIDGSPITQVFSTSAIPLSAGDLVETKWETFENMVMYSARNITQNSAWVSTAPLVLKNTETKYGIGKVRVNAYEGDYRLVSLKYSSKQIQNPDVYLFGDSKFTKSVYQNTSIPSRLNNDYLSVVANSGVNNTLADLVNASWEVINHVKPKAVAINSSNDIRFGVSSGTWQANIDTLYNRFTRYGIRVYFTCFYESSSSQAAMDTYLAANYSDYYFRTTYTALQACGSGCLVVDNIHLSDEGTKMAVDEIMKDGRLNGNWWSEFKDVGSIVPATPSSGYGVVYTRADSLRFKNDAGTEFTLGIGSTPSLNKAVTIEIPSSSEAVDMWQTPVAITVSSIKAILRGSSPSVTYNIRFGTDITSSTNVFTADITCTSITTGCSNSSGFNDATIPAGSFIWIVTTAASGTINSISFTINYTED